MQNHEVTALDVLLAVDDLRLRQEIIDVFCRGVAAYGNPLFSDFLAIDMDAHSLKDTTLNRARKLVAERIPA